MQRSANAVEPKRRPSRPPKDRLGNFVNQPNPDLAIEKLVNLERLIGAAREAQDALGRAESSVSEMRSRIETARAEIESAKGGLHDQRERRGSACCEE